MRIVTAIAGVAVVAMSFAALEPLAAIASCALGWAMLAIAISDARNFIVPDAISLPAIPVGLLVSMLMEGGGAPLMHLAAAGVGAVIFYAIRLIYFRLSGRHGLGLGDVKLAAVAGAWTGFEGLGLVLLLATVTAMSWIVVTHVAAQRPLDRSTAVPFGAFLAPAIWLTWWLMASGLDRIFGGPAA
jgi:leader peptidase (prepilin peptidase)/N-methyltransferase